MDFDMEDVEAAAKNCSLRLEHVEALNLSQNLEQLMRLYNMCEHTWDPDKTWGIYFWEELIPPLVIYILTLLLGVIGNLLILVAILGYKKMKSPTNVFLASLALADLLLCLICIPVKLAELFSFSWTFGLFLCKFVNYMQNVSAVASVLNLTVMSIERCYAIVHPMKAKSFCTVGKSIKVVFGVWILSFILALPTLIVQEHLEVGMVQKAFWCVRGGDVDFGSELPAWYWPAHEVYFTIILLLIPGGIMMAAYGAIARKLCQCMKERRTLTAERGSQKTNQNWCRSDRTWSSLKKRHSSRKWKPAVQEVDTMVMKDLKHTPSNSSRNVTKLKAPSSCCSCCHSCHFKKSKEEIMVPKDETDKKKHWIPLNNEYVVQDKALKKFRRVIKMLIVIIVVFALCWTPYLTFLLLQAFGCISMQLDGILKHAKTSFILMAYLNSALNPIIYGFMSKHFREGFTKALGQCWRNGRMTGLPSLGVVEESVARQPSPENTSAKFCCKHQERGVVTNNHGLRMNKSRAAVTTTSNGGHSMSAGSHPRSESGSRPAYI